MSVFETPVGTKYRVSKGRLLHTIPRLSKEWSVSLRLNLFGSEEKRPQSMLHVAEGPCGSGSPGIWTLQQRNTAKLKVTFPLDGDSHYSRELDNDLSREKNWTTVKVTHKLHGGKYYYGIFIYNQQAFIVQNRQKNSSVPSCESSCWEALIYASVYFYQANRHQNRIT